MGRKRTDSPPDAEQRDLLDDVEVEEADSGSAPPEPDPSTPGSATSEASEAQDPPEEPESSERPEETDTRESSERPETPAMPDSSDPIPEPPAMTSDPSDDTPTHSSPPPAAREVQMELPREVAREVEALEEAGSLERALEVVNAALVGHEASAPLLLKKVTLLGSLGRFEVAMEPLRTLRLLEPESPRVRLAGGLLLFRRGLYEEAERDFRAASFQEDIPETIREQARYYLAESLNRLERLDEALEILHATVESWPSERSFQLLGRLYDRKGSPEEANVMYRIARELDR